MVAGKLTRRDFVRKGTAMEMAGELGITVGIGGHSLEVPIQCERLGIRPDFYVKTFHDDNYWSAPPQSIAADSAPREGNDVRYPFGASLRRTVTSSEMVSVCWANVARIRLANGHQTPAQMR